MSACCRRRLGGREDVYAIGEHISMIWGHNQIIVWGLYTSVVHGVKIYNQPISGTLLVGGSHYTLYMGTIGI